MYDHSEKMGYRRNMPCLEVAKYILGFSLLGCAIFYIIPGFKSKDPLDQFFGAAEMGTDFLKLKDLKRSSENIFLIEANEALITISGENLCSLESAARSNPDKNVFLILSKNSR